MIAMKLGTKRYIRRFVVRKSIDGTTKSLQVAMWEEEWRKTNMCDDPTRFEFVPTTFLSENEFFSKAKEVYGSPTHLNLWNA